MAEQADGADLGTRRARNSLLLIANDIRGDQRPTQIDKFYEECLAYLEDRPSVAANLRSIAQDPVAITAYIDVGEKIFARAPDGVGGGGGDVVIDVEEEQADPQDVGVRSRVVGGRYLGASSSLNSLAADDDIGRTFVDVLERGLDGAMAHFDDEDKFLALIADKVHDLSYGSHAAMQRRMADANSNWAVQREALHEAVRESDVEAVKICLEGGCAVDAQDSNGVTPLGRAIQAGEQGTSCALVLLRGKANPLCVDSHRNGACHYAARHDAYEILHKILHDGRRIPGIVDRHLTLLNAQRLTPLDVAERFSTEDWILAEGCRKDSRMVHLIKRYGGMPGTEVQRMRREEEERERLQKEKEKDFRVGQKVRVKTGGGSYSATIQSKIMIGNPPRVKVAFHDGRIAEVAVEQISAATEDAKRKKKKIGLAAATEQGSALSLTDSPRSPPMPKLTPNMRAPSQQSVTSGERP